MSKLVSIRRGLSSSSLAAFVDKQHHIVEEAYQEQQAHEGSRGESAVPSVPIE